MKYEEQLKEWGNKKEREANKNLEEYTENIKGCFKKEKPFKF